ncbi:MAG TPA: AtpZ/AtpI family protein [Devosiaceae bacterium]|nr:AtpZ/AtpI family protein [Devosiaceae bacterium]
MAGRIARARGTRKDNGAESSPVRSGMTGAGRGFRLASEFVAAIVVGVLLGIGLDAVLGTGPWMAVGLLLLGFAAGVLNVVRATRDMNSAVTAEMQPTPDEGDD